MITYVNCVGLLFQYRNLPMQNYLEYLSFKVLFSLSSNCLRSPPLPTITSTPILWLTYFLTHLLHIRTYQVTAAGLSTMVYTAPEHRALAWWRLWWLRLRLWPSILLVARRRLGLVPSYFLCQDMQYLDYNIGSGISQMVDALTNYTSSIRFFNDLFEIV